MPHRTWMAELARDCEWQRGAVLGLGSGRLVDAMLHTAPALRLLCVDHFVRDDRRQRLLRIASQYSDRCVVYPLTTGRAAAYVLDASLDFVYIDAGHKYGCVRADLRAWWPKARTGAWFGGHDFHPDYPGVVDAVLERFGASVHVNEHNIWSVRKD